ncbi:transporter substrate-binding domain-containing protein [Devosia sp. WQ 349]|uniref:substrate-binding periplasmic protein n=1 Tax=Devosia sp. WQ 349K1 TaxID=2800329 RepID=UPI001902D307|nr:transporter substrate-binding domain-containing protein [Devosia sp. WQ 349K1]MBK1793231.1 transporter substrate-binding domain-containing protein [Devosia sp. WQ 349K1]
MSRYKRALQTFGPVTAVVALLVGVSTLPPDTSLRDIQNVGTLRACVPTNYPPLVTNDPAAPGVDIEILSAVSAKLNVTLVLSPSAEMGRDFNPLNWNLNRAKCQIVAGGVVASSQTRSFLETSPSYAQTGWAIVSKEPLPTLEGKTLGALTLVSGLNRIELAGYLRNQQSTVRVVPTEAAFADNINSGTFDGGVTEALLASQLATENNWNVAPVSDALASYPIVLGLWKGDLTLKHQVDAAILDMKADGTMDAILAKYGVKQQTTGASL